MEAIIFIWVINFAISIWNAIVVGVRLKNSRYSYGWEKITTWMGIVMSASGFTWCYMVVVGFFSYKMDYLSLSSVEAFFNIGYMIVVPFVITSGLIIMIDSWKQFMKKRDIANTVNVTWNTITEAHNTYTAVKEIPSVFENVIEYFNDTSRDRNSKSLVIILFIFVALAGILTTTFIVKSYAR